MWKKIYWKDWFYFKRDVVWASGVFRAARDRSNRTELCGTETDMKIRFGSVQNSFTSSLKREPHHLVQWLVLHNVLAFTEVFYCFHLNTTIFKYFVCICSFPCCFRRQFLLFWRSVLNDGKAQIETLKSTEILTI